MNIWPPEALEDREGAHGLMDALDWRTVNDWLERKQPTRRCVRRRLSLTSLFERIVSRDLLLCGTMLRNAGKSHDLDRFKAIA
jgi:hypothetical protein